jgi:ribA/ribD-fused uncharacterized protein
MRFFTHKYYFGSSEAGYRDVWARYRRHLEEMEAVLPPEVVEVARLPSMDDGLVVQVEHDRKRGVLTLVMRCGDLQVGYYDLTVRYEGARITPKDEWHLAVAAREGGDLAYHEVDRTEDGAIVHRLLFHPGLEVDVRCHTLVWERVDRPDWTLPAIRDRFPGGPDRLPAEGAWEGGDPVDLAAVRDRGDLIEAVRSGARPKYVFFWGHKPLAGGAIGKPCFSQWWSAPFEVDGVRYATAEHFMMAEKARLFGDEETRARILAAPGPAAAKQLGRSVRRFDGDRWEAERFGIVVRGNLAKFGQHPPLREFLLETRSRVLVEASPVDRIWGIGLAADDARAENPEQWRGLNLLGFALMEVRARLQDGRGV